MEWQPTHINRTHDRSFNLTNTYRWELFCAGVWIVRRRIFRTDSDVVRSFGSISHTLTLTRFDPRNGRLLESNEDHLNRLRKIKLSNQKPYHTLWFVSNCDHTWGAIERWKLGQTLIDEGIEFKITETANVLCIENQSVIFKIHKKVWNFREKENASTGHQNEISAVSCMENHQWQKVLKFIGTNFISLLKTLFIVQVRDFRMLKNAKNGLQSDIIF